MLDPVFLLALPAFGLTMGLEWAMLRRHPEGRKGYTLPDTLGSLGMGVGFLAVDAVWKVVTIGFFAFLYQHRLFDLPATVWTWLLLVPLDDLCMYWSHRLGHEVRLFWCAHHNHHSSERYNLSTALRQSWFEDLYRPLVWAPLPLLGFPVELIVLQGALNLLYQYWLHTELIGDMGRFGLVFNTPAFHRVHHGRNPRYLDRNYAGIFIVWDRLFGTFEPETEPSDYGVTTPLTTHNPLRIAVAELQALGRDLRGARSLRGALGYVFARPGWREDGQHRTSVVVRAEALAAEAAAASGGQRMERSLTGGPRGGAGP